MIDENIPYRIKRIYSSSTEKEKVYLRRILEEIAETGDSQTYRDIWLSDYIEIPVDIDTFLCDDYFLGKITRNGNAIYPFWRDFMRKLFTAGNKYEEVFLTGATRIGKSSTGITCTAYMLYKLMCLRDPQAYFGKKDVSVFSILFFNLTKELASSVAYREFQDTILACPWFLDHGKKMGSDKNPYYVPNGGKVVIEYGSDAAHSLGKQVFCLVGGTKILTDQGWNSLESLENSTVNVAQYHEGSICYSEADIKLTKYTDITIRVELEDGTVVEGTPDHPVMLSDGSYKNLGDLSSLDDLLTFNINEVDQMNLKDKYNRKFCVYKHTSPHGKVYIGITCEPVSKRWGKNGSGYRGHKHFESAINKYGWDNFKHEVLYENLSIDEASAKEIELIAYYNASDPCFGYNKTLGGEISIPSEETRKKLSESTTRLWKTPEYRNKVCKALMGHEFSEETCRKISESQRNKWKNEVHPRTGVPMSEETRRKLSESLKGQPAWNKGFTKYTHPSIMKQSITASGVPMSESAKKKLSQTVRRKYDEEGYSPIWINNGKTETLIDSSTSSIPVGFKRGRLDLDFVYIHKEDTDEENRVPRKELPTYLESGWVLGPSKRRGRGISKARQQFIWKYDGKEFNTAELLADYLRKHGYPKIVSSTITALYYKGFDKSKVYKELHGKITREDVVR